MGDGVCATLQDDDTGLVVVDDPVHDVSEEWLVHFIGHACFERNVDGIVLAQALAERVELAGAREEVLSVLMEAHRHHSVRTVKGFLHSVPVVHVDVHVQNSTEILQQLQYTYHDVIHIAKTTRLRLLSMVQSASLILYYFYI